MRPLDPRLLRHARSSRTFLLLGGALALVRTLATIAFAWLVTDLIVRAIAGEAPERLVPGLLMLLGVVALRAVTTWAIEVNAVRGGIRVKAELRARALAAVVRTGPGALAGGSGGAVALLGGGLDALDGYFARYLPQLVATAITTPLLTLVILRADPLSALFIVVTLPLIPVFMVLIGWATQSVQAAQFGRLRALASGFVDTVGGLATLRIFGRAERQGDRIRALTEDYRVRTMAVLRVTFVSGFVLELAGSLSVALVAVSIGLRLVDGSLGLAVGLFVLILAPDVFAPVRQVGAEFHAAADGVAAADEAFALIEESERLPVALPAAHPRGPLELTGFSVERAGRRVVGPLDLRAEPGTITAVTGASGAGKSTLLAGLLGFAPVTGSLALGGVPVPEGSPRNWLAWAGQSPSLLAGTVADTIALGSAGPAPERVARAAALAAVDLDLARELDAVGSGISGGQAARVAVARAVHRVLERDCAVLALDEPTAALDAETERRVLAGLREIAATGVVVLVVTHRAAVVGAADRVLVLEPARTAVP